MFSFIILTYNSKDTIVGCITSILEKSSGIDSEIIVVDNNSKDGTFDHVGSFFKDRVKVMQNQENLGFSAGVNVGIKAAQGEFLFILNPDASLDEIDFQKIHEKMRKGKIGILAPKVIWPNKVLQPSFGFFPTKANLFLYFFKFSKLLPKGFLVYNNIWNKRFYRQVSEVDWVSGCCMIIPREVIEDCGGFDEKYFLYVEDVDLCKRIKNKGYKIVVDPKIVVSHILQHSVKEDPFKNFDFQAEGFAYFFEKHYHQDISSFIKKIYSLKKKRVQK